MKKRPEKPRRVLWLLVAGLAVGLVLIVWIYWPSKPQSSPTETFPLPPYSASRFLNTGADAQYVGTDQCASCHRSNHQSYLLTAHSRSLSVLDPKAEPPDGSFYHKASGHSYRVYRQNGQLRHEDILRTAEGKEIARVDLPISYLIGSGNFARSYLVEVDGFLHESPITWYASKKEWGMSPGYDVPKHYSFERPITAECLACHVGRMDAAGTVHRTTITENAIGCESCHGPGAKHVAAHQDNLSEQGDEDLTIVNPRRLSRSRLEAVCGECHLNGPARVMLRGRQVGAFRPGMPLTDYHIDYHFDTGTEQMTVVGHMEQLRQSACYKNSKELSCLTCHDPHATEKPNYRQKCLNCHTDQSCKLAPATRRQQDVTDNCVTCHMPRGDTDIPHLAFTHHRIGLHAPKPPPALQRIPELVPTDDVSHLSPREQERNLGLAYLDAAGKREYRRYAGEFAERAIELLGGVYEVGLREGDVADGLAELCLPVDPARGRVYARQALAAKDVPPEVRAKILILLARCETEDHNYEAAIGLLKELVLLRRNSEDWGTLGMCYLLQKQPHEALPALQQALSIRPDNYSIHLELAETYRQLGDTLRSREHQEKAEWLRQHGHS